MAWPPDNNQSTAFEEAHISTTVSAQTDAGDADGGDAVNNESEVTNIFNPGATTGVDPNGVQTAETPLSIPSAPSTTATIAETITTSSLPTSFETIPTITSASTNSQNDNDNDGGGGGLSNNTKIAIAVPVAIVGAAIIAVLLFFLIRRRRQQQQRQSQPVILTPQLITSSAVFRPAQILPVPTPVPARIPRRAVPQGTYPEQTEIVPSSIPAKSAAIPVPGAAGAAATRDLEWRTSEERGAHGPQRPGSPFDHPLDNEDAVSVVSGMEDPEGMMRGRGIRDDDMSSVSSFEDDDVRPRVQRGGQMFT